MWFSKGALFIFFFSSFKEIDPDQSFFAFFMEVPTAPRPILRMPYQLSSHRISVHVVQFLPALPSTPHVKIIESPLPKALRPARLFRKRKPELSSGVPHSSLTQRSRDSLLQYLHHFGQRTFGRLAHQQVHVLWHQHIPNQQERMTLSHFPKNSHEHIPCVRRT